MSQATASKHKDAAKFENEVRTKNLSWVMNDLSDLFFRGF